VTQVVALQRGEEAVVGELMIQSEVVGGAADYCLPAPAICGQPSPGALALSGSLLGIEGEGVALSAHFVRAGVTYSRLWNASGVPRWAGVNARGSDELVAVSLSLGEGERLARGRLLSRPWACGWCDCRGWNGPDRNREGKREGEMSEAGIHVTEMGDHPVDVAMKCGGV
jgi:hypothetical protein